MNSRSALTNSVVLVGMPGAGKSSVAGHLLTRLARGWRLVDTDQAVEQSQRASIPEIFARAGEQQFRELESAEFQRVLAEHHVVVSTGGGIVLSEANRRLMTEADATVVYLYAPVDTLVTRVGRGGGRPLLAGTDVRARLDALFAQRHPLYESVADLVVDVSLLTVDAVAERIVSDLHLDTQEAGRGQTLY